MTKPIRSDKVAGPITGVFGLALILFGAFALGIVAVQRLMMSSMPPRRGGSDHFDQMMNPIQGAWITYLPFMIVGGLVFGVAGFYIYRGSLAARRIAQTNAVLGFIWVIAYSIESYRVMQTMVDLPLSQSPVFQWVLIILNMIIFLAFPAALLFILSGPRADPEGN